MCLSPSEESCVVNSCCLCFSLRVGTLIIGYLNLIGNIILSILIAILLAGGGLMLTEDSSDQQAIGGVILIVAIILLVVFIINLGFTIALLVGAHKEQRGHVKAYLIFNMICIVLTIIVFIISFFGDVSVGGVMEGIVGILIQIYFWVVIRSHYIKMGEMSKEPPVFTYNGSNVITA